LIQPGDIIAERFITEALIGTGGMASVYRVRHRQLGTTHAIKLLASRSEAIASRLLREGRIQAQLKHPHVVAVTDVLSHEGTIGLLMEYIDAINLVQLINERGPLTSEETLELMAPIFSGMHAAHQIGVLHRDVKPANILIRRDVQGFFPMITDFGIAKVLSESLDGLQTADGVVMGTPGYMAPEQFLEPDDVDVRTDIFALGSMVYELLTGAPAFKGKSGFLSLRTTSREEVVSLTTAKPGLPENIAAAVMQALEKEQSLRPQSILALVAQLYANHPQLIPTEMRTAVTLAPLTEERPMPGGQPTPTEGGENAAEPAKQTTTKRKSTFWLAGSAIGAGTFLLFLTGAVLVVVALLLNNTPSTTKEEVSPGVPLAQKQAASQVQPSSPPPRDPLPPSATIKETAPPQTKSISTEKTGEDSSPPPATPRKAAVTTGDTQELPPEPPQEPESTTEPVTGIEAAETVGTNTEETPSPPTETVVLSPFSDETQVLNGRLFRQPFTLEFLPTVTGPFSAKGKITIGNQQRTLLFSGRYDSNAKRMRFAERDGDLIIEGAWSEAGLSGTSQRGNRKATAITLVK
jgi:serine/threonine-protein kinase